MKAKKFFKYPRPGSLPLEKGLGVRFDQKMYSGVLEYGLKFKTIS